MNYLELYQAIQDYSENTESLFVQNIPRFVMEAEERIYNSVQIPALRKNVTGNTTASNSYLSVPSDFLSTYSIAVVDATGSYNYLLNKDVNFIRASYPKPTTTGLPQYYAIFGPQYSDLNSLSFLLGPTPDSSYSVEMHYFYYPVSIVQGVISTISISNAGSAYTNGTYENVALSSGSGAGAIATITIAGGVITNVAIINGGSLYVVGDILTASSATIGNTGSNFTVTVTAVDNSAGTSWLGINYDPVLLYGAMREAMLFMKGEQDLVTYYEQKYQEALGQLKRLGDGLERGDAYRDGQTKLQVTS
jgi:hypothetical protein